MPVIVFYYILAGIPPWRSYHLSCSIRYIGVKVLHFVNGFTRVLTSFYPLPRRHRANKSTTSSKRAQPATAQPLCETGYTRWVPSQAAGRSTARLLREPEGSNR